MYVQSSLGVEAVAVVQGWTYEFTYFRCLLVGRLTYLILRLNIRLDYVDLHVSVLLRPREMLDTLAGASWIPSS